MPYCNIKTNVKVEKKKELSKELTKVIELIPGKTENWIMTSISVRADYFEDIRRACPTIL